MRKWVREAKGGDVNGLFGREKKQCEERGRYEDLSGCWQSEKWKKKNEKRAKQENKARIVLVFVSRASPKKEESQSKV